MCSSSSNGAIKFVCVCVGVWVHGMFSEAFRSDMALVDALGTYLFDNQSLGSSGSSGVTKP